MQKSKDCLFLLLVTVITNNVNCAPFKNNTSDIKAEPTILTNMSSSTISLHRLISPDIPSILSNVEQVQLKRITDISRVGNLTRNHGGDIFQVYESPKCNTDTCIGLSSGTADLCQTDVKEIDTTTSNFKTKKIQSDVCKCQCLPHLTTYREDLGICVDDIHECTLAPFVSGSSSERIPFVFLPLRGQIIHPSKEIYFSGVQMPICAVSGSQFLTNIGWTELRSQVDTDVPFRLFRDEGRTFLQWLGEPELRHKMQGRLILVHLLCRDTNPLNNENETTDSSQSIVTTDLLSARHNTFTPCVAFRVVGTPVKLVNNVTEVSFASDTHIDREETTSGLTTKEYVVIGICSLLLGLIYVASVFLYLHMKKRKNESHSGSMCNPKSEINYPKNEEVTFGQTFSRSENLSIYERGTEQQHKKGIQNNAPERKRSHSTSSQKENRIRTNVNNNLAASNITMGTEDAVIVKNNPLLSHFANLNENPMFMDELTNNSSDCDEHDMTRVAANIKNLNAVHQTSAMIHPSANNSSKGFYDSHQRSESSPSPPSQEIECLPEENVSIIEDMSAEDKLENMRAIVNGTMRRKLYFNPAYFEPHLLQSPPLAAIEFLTKIREVITIAKYKMSSKRFQPSLNLIPEEFHDSEGYSNTLAISSQRNSLNFIRSGSSQKECIGCPGCLGNKLEKINCQNCGDKRNSIRKWLEGVSANDNNNESNNSDLDQFDSNHGFNNSKENGPVKKKTESDNISTSSDNDTVKENSINSKRSGTTKPHSHSGKNNNTPKIISTSPKDDLDRIVPDYKITQSEEREIYNNRQTLSEKVYSKSIETNDCYGTKPNNLTSKHIDPSCRHNQKYDQIDLYQKLSKNGGDLFNNPQFQHTSPVPSQRSRNIRNSQKLKSSQLIKKQTEVLDQFSNPHPNNEQLRHYQMLKNIQHMPDMVYEALAMDYTKMNSLRTRDYKQERNFSINNSNKFYALPKPDYHLTDEERNIIQQKNLDIDDPYVPTPDYNSYNRLQKRQHYQPDSPIYSRKSPHFLIVDYETDSLERSSPTKLRSSGSSPPSGSSSGDSSQASPSLSSALPLEEEVEIRNAVYDRIEGFRKDTEQMKNIDNIPIYDECKLNKISNVPSKPHKRRIYSQNKIVSPQPARVKYNEGSMTIEVDHSPQELDTSTDSDQFEPDTLDRKPKRTLSSNCNVSNNSTNLSKTSWAKSQECLNNNNIEDNLNFSSLENVNSLPDLNSLNQLHNNQLILRTSGSFKNDLIISNKSNEPKENVLTSQRNFSSLREIYESKNNKNSLSKKKSKSNNLDFSDVKGKLLTLDARHSRRQRKTNDGSLKNVTVPPDVVPPSFSNHNSFNPVIQNKNHETNDKTIIIENTESEGDQKQYDHDFYKDYSKVDKLSKFNSLRKSPESQEVISEHNGCFINEMQTENHYGILENYLNLGDIKNQHFLHTNISNNEISDADSICSNSDRNENNQNEHEPNYNDEDAKRIELISINPPSKTSTLNSNKSNKSINSEHQQKFSIDESLTTAKVFRVEVNQPTHGMQIAMGLKSTLKVKKSKDIKNTWKKLMSIATTKFNCNPKQDDNKIYDQSSTATDYGLTKDNCLTSKTHILLERRLSPKSELDGGYMSTDSNESRLQNGRYERYSFKHSKNCANNNRHCNSNIYDLIEDIKENCENSSNEKALISSLEKSSQATKRENKNAICISQIPSTSNNTISNLHHPMNCILEIKDAININVYSSEEDERYNSSETSSSVDSNDEDDDDDNCSEDDACGSGAESIETHSVLFKNIRK